MPTTKLTVVDESSTQPETKLVLNAVLLILNIFWLSMKSVAHAHELETVGDWLAFLIGGASQME
ncbi:hypothetical protein FN846DRAFT_906712 [Sphaerosporella brunnea]|uniref:Uncharacterized protein n=1 Tax=Sphaerosporella brunnea TaxID=1250544 RepID=A0A5J5EZ80_9PEZI|nr:hypothetical protein FN846DRAFT_906712 [Sphaerosporella brunnea]